MLTVSIVVVCYIVVSCALTIALLPYNDKITGNFLVVSLIFFNNLNIFIAICEICLGFYISYIKEDYQDKLKKYGNGRDKLFQGLGSWVNMPITIRQVFHGKTWAQMWSTYALLDPSYQNNESFGFFIDVGNGWTTIPPCLLLNYAMIKPNELSPLLVGCVTIASFWQMLYGTIIYFLSYLFNKRYKGRGWIANSIVFFANVVWMLFPGLAIYAAVQILKDNNFDSLSS